ncbi:DMT family transporter [Magnetospirillum fulvum]|uniref:Permease of the drug/metabolite transporter (DMT) superfamily n=1 Tax=Magnetospirillum fulvum TaxID=1082 RepID=A0A1H6GVF7_MAGFU|nr:DMT family transporter [Magnetospirillum fulvum]SEH25815.1 Permease of the drug/metabolite transporter (DMT) superfamily [Magnetospirillum fulvum]
MERGLSKIQISGLLLLIPPPLFWAGNFIVGRAMRGEVPPMTLSLWRWVIAFLCLLPLAWRPMCRDWPAYWAHRWLVLRLALVGVVAFNSIVYLGLQWTAAENGLLLNSFIPILILLFGALFYGQSLHRWQVIGLILSFAGVLTIILHGDWTRLARLDFSVGDLVVFSAMVSWAFYTLWQRAIPPQIDRIGLMGIQIAVAIPFLFVLYLGERLLGYVPHWSPEAYAALGYIGLFPSVIAYLLYTIGVARVGAVRAGMFIHLMPVFGVALAVIFLGETVQPYHLVGITAILVGIWSTSRKGG